MPVELEAVFTKYYYAWGINACFFGKYSVPPKRFIRNFVEQIHKIYPKYYCNPYFYGNIEPRLISKMLENDYYIAQELKSKECDYKLFYFQPDSFYPPTYLNYSSICIFCACISLYSAVTHGCHKCNSYNNCNKPSPVSVSYTHLTLPTTPYV